MVFVKESMVSGTFSYRFGPESYLVTVGSDLNKLWFVAEKYRGSLKRIELLVSAELNPESLRLQHAENLNISYIPLVNPRTSEKHGTFKTFRYRYQIGICYTRPTRKFELPSGM